MLLHSFFITLKSFDMEPIFAVAFILAVIISTALFVILISHYKKNDKPDKATDKGHMERTVPVKPGISGHVA